MYKDFKEFMNNINNTIKDSITETVCNIIEYSFWILGSINLVIILIRIIDYTILENISIICIIIAIWALIASVLRLIYKTGLYCSLCHEEAVMCSEDMLTDIFEKITWNKNNEGTLEGYSSEIKCICFCKNSLVIYTKSMYHANRLKSSYRVFVDFLLPKYKKAKQNLNKKEINSLAELK